MAKILIVDDEEDICKFLGEFFSEYGYEIAAANSGEEALEIITSYMPDIVLLDLILPEMDGIAVLRKIRENPAIKDVKVIMVTAIETDDKINEAKTLGVENYITKPLSIENLQNEVDKIAGFKG